jgi:hypothetical protein
MRVLIRTLETGATGVAVAKDRVVDVDVINFGRATDQQIQCNDQRIALHHARFTRAEQGLLLSCSATMQAEVNGRMCRDALLRVGDQISFGPILIKVLETPGDVYAALSVERDSRESTLPDDAPIPNFADSLAAVGWRKRPWAWAGITATLLFGLILPWFFLSRGEASIGWLRDSVLPSDLQWSAGALHSAHGNLAMECEACHAKPFQRVQNVQCLDCHGSNLHLHLPADHPAARTLAAARCTDCHVEHDEPSDLIQPDTRVCATCHSQPQDHGARAQVMPVSDFAAQHPDFRVSLLVAPDWKVSRARLGAEPLVEKSNLEFTHKAHLDPRGIKAPQGEVVMGCADCHAADDSGAGFRPIRMEEHCGTCHTLGFDPAEPERKLPHGEPALVMQTLIDHYSRRFLGGYADDLARAGDSRPPGASLSAAARARALGSATQRANLVAADLFERRICADCHLVTRSGTDSRPQWAVAPVKLTRSFMPKARFDHAAHSTAQSACATCHAAKESTQAADVLMPSIKTCRDCHGGETGSEDGLVRIASPCASCHEYHDGTEPLWVPAKVMRKVIAKADSGQ